MVDERLTRFTWLCNVNGFWRAAMCIYMLMSRFVTYIQTVLLMTPSFLGLDSLCNRKGSKAHVIKITQGGEIYNIWISRYCIVFFRIFEYLHNLEALLRTEYLAFIGLNWGVSHYSKKTIYHSFGVATAK